MKLCVYVGKSEMYICNQKKNVHIFSLHEGLKSISKSKEKPGKKQVLVFGTIHLYTNLLFLLVVYRTDSQYVVSVTFHYVFIIRYTLFTTVK